MVGVHSNFCFQPNYSVEVVLCCVVVGVGVVTISYMQSDLPDKTDKLPVDLADDDLPGRFVSTGLASIKAVKPSTVVCPTMSYTYDSYSGDSSDKLINKTEQGG